MEKNCNQRKIDDTHVFFGFFLYCNNSLLFLNSTPHKLNLAKLPMVFWLALHSMP